MLLFSLILVFCPGIKLPASIDSEETGAKNVTLTNFQVNAAVEPDDAGNTTATTTATSTPTTLRVSAATATSAATIATTAATTTAASENNNEDDSDYDDVEIYVAKL